MVDLFFYTVLLSVATGSIQWFFQEVSNIRIENDHFHKRIEVLRRINE